MSDLAGLELKVYLCDIFFYVYQIGRISAISPRMRVLTAFIANVRNLGWNERSILTFTIKWLRYPILITILSDKVYSRKTVFADE